MFGRLCQKAACSPLTSAACPWGRHLRRAAGGGRGPGFSGHREAAGVGAGRSTVTFRAALASLSWPQGPESGTDAPGQCCSREEKAGHVAPPGPGVAAPRERASVDCHQTGGKRPCSGDRGTRSCGLPVSPAGGVADSSSAPRLSEGSRTPGAVLLLPVQGVLSLRA